MTNTIIAWDLGATKCAAGIVEFHPHTHVVTCRKRFCIKLAQTQSLEDLIDKIEIGLGVSMRDADAICIAAAGHYDGEMLLLAGTYPYLFPFAKVAREQQWPAYEVIHDYAPIVCATFTSYMQEVGNVKYLNPKTMEMYQRRVALGIGTGLGLKDGVLLPNGDFWLGKNEMGHVGITLPPEINHPRLAMHHELMAFMQHHLPSLPTNPPVTFEKVLSGKGLVRLYHFLYPNRENTTPEQVGIGMGEGKLPELQSIFAWYLGLFIGTVQLTFMPAGGIWITGGVALSHLEVFEFPEFQEGIQASPAYAAQRDEYPLGILCNQDHALIGCGYYAGKRLLEHSTQPEEQIFN